MCYTVRAYMSGHISFLPPAQRPARLGWAVVFPGHAHYGGAMTEDEVSVVGAIAKVSTLADGGIRVTVDLPEDAVDVAAWLMEVRRALEAIMVTFARAE